jgi:hypothetical protein
MRVKLVKLLFKNLYGDSNVRYWNWGVVFILFNYTMSVLWDTSYLTLSLHKCSLQYWHVASWLKGTTVSAGIANKALSWMPSLFLNMSCVCRLWLFTVLRLAQKFFTCMETSSLPVEGCKIKAYCSALGASKQGGIFIVPHLLWHGETVFPVSSKEPPHSVAFTTHKGMWRTF